MKFRLQAIRSEGDTTPIEMGEYETAEDAEAKVLVDDAAGIWPEAHEAVLTEIETGKQWIYLDSWVCDLPSSAQMDDLGTYP